MKLQDPLAIYAEQTERFSGQKKKLAGRQSLIAYGRFISLAGAFACFWYLKPSGLLYAFTAAAALFAVFLRLVVLSVKNNEQIRNVNFLLQINHEETEIANGRYTGRPDGSQYLPATHDYALDLDIFGRASLYQYLNRTTSEQGSLRLSEWLLGPASPREIIERQESAKELQSQYQWRQQLQAFGLEKQITLASQKKIEAWLEEPGKFTSPAWRWCRYLFPALVCGGLLLYLADWLPSQWLTLIVFVAFLGSGYISRKVTPVYHALDRIAAEITVLSKTVKWIEEQQFTAALLKQLQGAYLNGSASASLEVRSLTSILDRFDYRVNPLVFIPLNTFLFWDLQQALSLERWKSKNKELVSGWFEALAEIEALSTIAALRFNHPEWCYPQLAAVPGTMRSEDLGHPLIPAHKRVCSSFDTSGVGRLALITGSNMAGKSTFLRSVGVNIVLAMMGAAVCAKALALSPMRVASSMRISDNLEESTSTFYAELKKLKQIIEAVNRGEKIFILLDEILRGTNSLDRHTGSGALIKQLVRKGAVGMLATHDLELAGLSGEYPGNITNYHFDVQVANDELYFDYQLKEGVCKSMNASILMKKIGIEL